MAGGAGGTGGFGSGGNGGSAGQPGNPAYIPNNFNNEIIAGGSAGTSPSGVGGPGAAGDSQGGSAAGGGGGGGGNGDAASPRGGDGGSGGAGASGSGLQSNAGGGGGEGGAGLLITGDYANSSAVQGGNGGKGGNAGAAAGGGISSGGGGGGDGGVGIAFSSTGVQLTNNPGGSITGGNGGAGGSGSPNGAAGRGGAGIVGTNLSVTNAGTIAGGVSGDAAPVQADAIDFTGGTTNSLTLNTTTSNGGLTGGLGLGGTVTITPNAVGTTLTSILHDYSGTVTGNLVKTGVGTLTLLAANTYTGGTTLNAGTLELGQQTSAGTGAITFGAAGEILQIDTTGTLGASSVAGFAANDAIDLAALNASGATATYASGKLTVSGALAVSGAAASEAIAIAAAPSGQEYAISADANGHAVVKLAAIPAPTITAPANGTDTNNNEPTISGTGESGDTVQLTIALQGSGTTTATAAVVNNAWSYTPTGALADGSYSVTTVETSPSGTGTSGTSNTETFTVDTTLSTPTIAFAASNSAAGAADVNAAHAAMAGYTVGSVDPDATATVTFTGTLKSTGASGTVAGVGTDGNYTVDLSGFRDGTVTASISDSDTAGNARTGANVSTTLDTTRPTITALAESGAGIDSNGNGDLGANKTVTLTVTTSEPVYVSGGTPTLTLNDGGVATYTGGSGTAQQTFSYTVASGQNTAKLAVTGVNANGAAVTDAAGNALNPSIMGAAVPSGTLIVDTTPPVAPSVTDTVAQGSGSTPIGLAAPSDNLTPAGSLAIAAGTLPTDGTVALANGTAVTSGQALTAAQLTGLLFTPTGTAGQSSAFTYTVTDGAGNASQGTATLNVGAPSPTPAAPDAVSIASQVTYDGRGRFTLTGTASSATGVRSVEISALVDGTRQDLGAATVNADGTYTFADQVGDQQTFFVATLTDGMGRQATSADPGFNLTGGLGPNGGIGKEENFDATEQVSTTLYRANGTRFVGIEASGQTVSLQPSDVVANHHQAGTSFVYTPGAETGVVDVIGGFKLGGADHDTIALPSADFRNFAAVLRNTGDVGGSAFITDPKTGDAIRLAGVTTAELKAHPKDFSFV